MLDERETLGGHCCPECGMHSVGDDFQYKVLLGGVGSASLEGLDAKLGLKDRLMAWYRRRMARKHARKRPHISQGNHEEFSHTETMVHAYDYFMPVGTPVLCFRDGVVVDVAVDFRRGGVKKKFKNKSNFVIVRHSDGTYGRYFHLQYKGAVVSVGDYVKRGQLLCFSGSTGFSEGPHLHFDVVDIYGKETSTIRVETKLDGKSDTMIDSCFATFSYPMKREDTVQGEMVWAMPEVIPSSGLRNDVTDCVVVCRRGGSSTFFEKALIAQKAKARALIIVNNDKSLGEVLPMIGSGDIKLNDQITIPVLLVSHESGLKLQDLVQQQSIVTIGVSEHLIHVDSPHRPKHLPFCKPMTQPISIDFSPV